MVEIKIGVFLTVFNRLENLKTSLEQLAGQTFQDFDLIILNNNIFRQQEVENVAYDTLKGRLEYSIIHSKVNHGPMIRYIEAVNHGYTYSVFLDDDELFHKQMMDDFDRAKEPHSLKAYMGFNFDKDIKLRKRVLNGNAKVLGPGGMILDTSILGSDFFEKWKLEFYVCDDLWLSFYASKKGYKKEVADIRLIMPRETNPSIAMLYNENIASLKQKFVEDYGWYNES